MTQEQRERLLELREWLTGSSTGPDQKMVYLSEALGIIADCPTSHDNEIEVHDSEIEDLQDNITRLESR